MKLFLHIGTDKTGSTAIQKHLFLNRQWLLERGVYVPETGLGRDTGHMGLLRDMDKTSLDHLSNELSAAKRDGFTRAVISWEGMSFMQPDDIALLGKTLAGEDPWLLVYLREQADIVQTGYLQEIKTGRTPFDIRDFSGLPWRPRQVRALRYCYSPMRDYAKLLRRWMTIIPRGQVHVREFHRELLINGNVVDDFLHIVGPAPDEEFHRVTQDTNFSLDVESALTLNKLDRHADLSPGRDIWEFTLLSLINSGGFGKRYFLNDRRVAAIRRHYRRSNESIAEVIGDNLPSLFTSAPHCSRDYTEEDIGISAAEREGEARSLLKIPMLFRTTKPHMKLDERFLVSGWGPMEDWGAWNSEPVSEIRFRVPFWMINHERGQFVIFLKGRYSGDSAQSTVVVNGQDFGRQDLRRFRRKITLPVDGLAANEIVSVFIHHETKPDPTEYQADLPGPARAFGIERIGMQFVNPD